MYIDDLMEKVISILVFILLLFAIIISCLDFVQICYGKSAKIETEEIYSIGIKSSNNGNFVLGTGSVSGKLYYVTYKKLDNGGKQLVKYPAEKTVIFETLNDNENTYVEVSKSIMGNIMTINLYLPKNTIIEEYSINLNN